MSSPEPVVKLEFPLLPLRDVVVYPHMVLPLFVGRAKSIKALEQAMQANKQVVLIAQKDANDDDPSAEGLYEIGTVASILQLLKLPDGTVKVLVEGAYRAHIHNLIEEETFVRANVSAIETQRLNENDAKILMSTVLHQFEQ